jgi:hypothetical protein
MYKQLIKKKLFKTEFLLTGDAISVGRLKERHRCRCAHITGNDQQN